LPPDTPDRPLRNKRDLAALLQDICNKILREELDSRIGYIAGHLANLSLKALEEAEGEEIGLLCGGTREDLFGPHLTTTAARPFCRKCQTNLLFSTHSRKVSALGFFPRTN
jgi:hypothetical protein